MNADQLVEMGKLRTEWAALEMPVLALERERLVKERTFDGMRIAICAHLTSETANLGRALVAGGASLAMTASNPLSTQDDVVELMRSEGARVHGKKGEDIDSYNEGIVEAVGTDPHLVIDDGGDLISYIHLHRKDLIGNVIGGAEETTTGVKRLRNMEKAGTLLFPVIAVNDCQTKMLFDNRYGTGQSTIDGILRATNRMIAGANFVVGGYGWCGRGVASCAKGLNAHTIVTEIDPVRALQAAMDGHRVMTMEEAAEVGDFFVTTTGNRSIIRLEHMTRMKDGAIIANSGHFDVEIDMDDLRNAAKSTRPVRHCLDEFEFQNGRRIYVVGEGRLSNLASAEGHPASVMDMSFADQVLSLEYLVKNKGNLSNAVHRIPLELDQRVAMLKLKTMGVEIDQLTEKQNEYLNAWESGT
ncbi:MAG: adenosylhomocysteinase [Candidatus Eisenbacteria sp.]|nr:adenosylhomocysteinase [Candidatus Eisenbacteria bacterium]